MSTTPPVPITLEGACMLHQFFRFNWKAWRALPAAEQERIAKDAAQRLQNLTAAASSSTEAGRHTAPAATRDQSVLFSQLGHKADLMLIHLRGSFAELNRVELQLAQLELYDYLEQTHSYVSVVELGLYESTAKTYSALAEQGVTPHSPEWDTGILETVSRQSAAMASRLYPAIPEAAFACFYPMDRKRGEDVNWYLEPMADRQRMMHEHGLIGRRYAGEVKQIISGSIGLDDWEWGVDLFADDPVVFKRLIYEMRFDEVSAKYALFGQFYVGLRLPIEKLPNWLSGSL